MEVSSSIHKPINTLAFVFTFVSVCSTALKYTEIKHKNPDSSRRCMYEKHLIENALEARDE